MPVRLLGSQRIEGNTLYFGDTSAQALVAEFGTPLYIFDAPHFRETIRRFVAAAKSAHEDSSVAYACKANSALVVLAIAAEGGLDIDVASEGELEASLRATSVHQKHIHVHGSNKSRWEMERALTAGIGYIVIDNLPEIEMLSKICAKKQRVMLRLAPGVDPMTHAAISTGQEDTKFGLNIADGSAEAAVRAVMKVDALELCGYHCHVGSQLLDCEAVATGGKRLAEFAIRMEDIAGPAEELNVGGGLGVSYLPEQHPPTFEEFCRIVVDSTLEPFQGRGLPLPKISYEPGRALVAEAGTTLYSVGAIKDVNSASGEKRRYLSVDGGMADNPRPQLYGAIYYAFNASRARDPHEAPFRISGRHCETDTLIPDIGLPAETNSEDLVAVQCTGAYNYSMASNYNRYPRPAMVVVGDHEPYLAVERESLDDVFAKERFRLAQTLPGPRPGGRR